MSWVNAVIQGILIGGLYTLFACGLSLMFGVMKVINLAHGDLAVAAGYIAVDVIPVTHIPAVWSFVIVVPAMALIGYVLQRTLIQASLNRGVLTTLLVTFGLSVVIQNALLQFFSANSHSLNIGSLVSDSFNIGSQISIVYLLLVIFLVAVVVLLGLQYYLTASRPGRLIRAVADDREAAQLAGADYRHVFGIAAAIAFATVALGGVAYGMFSTFNPTIGHRPPAAVRLRGRRHRRPGVVVGHADRRERPRGRPTGRRADQRQRPDSGRLPGLPAGSDHPPAGPDRRQELVVRSVTARTPPAQAQTVTRVTRSRRPAG
jgi:branched-chain amino acid transport system permease protein